VIFLIFFREPPKETRSWIHRQLTAIVRPLFAIKPVWFLRLPGEMLLLARAGKGAALPEQAGP
jgi:hypothetical protein